MPLKDPSFASQSIYPLTLLYDGKCEDLSHEVDDLRAADVSKRLLFVDVSAKGFDAERFGKPMVDLRNEIHAVRPDGQFLRGERVWRLAYAAVGRGWLFAPAQWHVLRPLVQWVHWVLSQHRYLLNPGARPWLTKIRQLQPIPEPLKPVTTHQVIQNPLIDASLALIGEMPVLSDAVAAQVPARGPVGGWQDTLPRVAEPAEMA